jgi:hypothetical protein
VERGWSQFSLRIAHVVLVRFIEGAVSVVIFASHVVSEECAFAVASE